jgi:hypothetical protein
MTRAETFFPQLWHPAFYSCEYICILCILKIKMKLNSLYSETSYILQKTNLEGSSGQIGRWIASQTYKGEHPLTHVCTRPDAKTELCVCWVPPAGTGNHCREVNFWASTEVPSLCFLHSDTRLYSLLLECSFSDKVDSWHCLWRWWICLSQSLGSMCYHHSC